MRRFARNAAGFALVLAGIAMLVLPGPGWVTIALGLALLAKDFRWARRSLDGLKSAAEQGADRSRGFFHRTRRRFSRSD